MDNKEIIEKLRELNSLILRFGETNDYLENGCAKEAIDKIDQVKASVAVLPGVPSVASAMPVFPEGKEAYQKAKEETAQSGKITTIALAVTAGSFLLWLIAKWELLPLLTVAAGVAWYILNKNHKNNKQGLAKKEKAYKDSLARAKASQEAFHQALSCYDREVETGLADAKIFGQYYREQCQEHEKILESYQENKEKAEALRDEIYQEITEKHDYIPAEYYHHIPNLIALLQSGRADNYKEALNMAIEEERQDAMEAARQEEEARRTAAIERQAEEERRHNMAMERQQAAHDRAMERAAQEQAEVQRRATIQAEKDRRRAESEAFHQKTVAESEARKQAAATKGAGISKCASCANSRNCPSHIKNSGAGLTCGGYRPYGS